jgi:hypothetical protein
MSSSEKGRDTDAEVNETDQDMSQRDALSNADTSSEDSSSSSSSDSDLEDSVVYVDKDEWIQLHNELYSAFKDSAKFSSFMTEHANKKWEVGLQE